MNSVNSNSSGIRHKRVLLGLLAALPVLIFCSAASAHFNTVIPDKLFAKKGKAVNFIFFWGHPYEHIIFDTPPPVKMTIKKPDESIVEIDSLLENKTAKGEAKKKASMFHFAYTPNFRGDGILFMDFKPVFIEEEGVFWADHLKEIIHVQTQNGWDNRTNQIIELVPLTRPYGLEPGFVFQAQLLFKGTPLPYAEVQIEKYLPVAPKAKDLPDDSMITRLAKTDPNGVVTYTLNEKGWYVLCAFHKAGSLKHNGKEYPLIYRACFWLCVGDGE